MERPRYIVDCVAVRDMPSFVRVMNDGFIRQVGGSWNGNLDAFNDYLSWPEAPYELVLLNAGHLPAALGMIGESDRAVWEEFSEIFEDNRGYCILVGC